MDNDGKSVDERRSSQRNEMLLKVEYKDASQFLTDYTENISQGGLFIATDEIFSVGTAIDFQVSFPGLLDPIPMKGLVKWCRAKGPGQEAAGIGIQFLMDQSAGNLAMQRLAEGVDRGSGAAVSPTTFRILLVEDNLVVRDMFRFGIQKFSQQRNLANVKVEVAEAGDGKEAWELLQQKPFHLLVVDLYMPVMDGSTLIQNVRRHPRLQDVPIMVVSSGGREGRQTALKSGADVYLDKPVKLKQMTETIATLIAIGHMPRKH